MWACQTSGWVIVCAIGYRHNIKKYTAKQTWPKLFKVNVHILQPRANVFSFSMFCFAFKPLNPEAAAMKHCYALLLRSPLPVFKKTIII